jgi:hypothetical protein
MQEVLLTTALQQQQQQQRMTPAELSCFAYCLASWGSSSTVTQHQLQQLEQQMVSGIQQQQQHNDVAAAAEAAAAAASSNWDGPAVCSCCWSLVKLGCQLQPQTLQAAEQHIQQLMPAAAAAAALDTTTTSSSSSIPAGLQQRLAAPSAQDLAMFGAACRQSSYQPMQLMSQFRSWLLLQLARQGSSALLKLSTRSSASNRAAAAAARRSTAAAARDSSSSSNSQQQASVAAPPVASQHANVLVCVLMLLRQINYADKALLQQLDIAASRYPTAQQLTGQQLVMCLSSFRRLGHFPGAWWSSGLRALLDKHAAQLSARDCVELLEVLAAWRQMPGVGRSTRMRQRILPRIEQRLLGQVWAPKQARSSSSSSRVDSSSSADSSPAGSPASSLSSSSSSSDSEQDTTATAAAAVALDSSEAAEPSQPAATAAAAQPRTAATAATGTSLIAELTGPQTVWLLHSIGQLGLNNQQLKRQAFRRLQAVWAQLQLNDQVAAAAAAGRLGFDAAAMMNVAELTQQQDGTAGGAAAEQGVSGGTFRSVSAAARTLWMFGNLGKHPGPALVDAALSHVAAAAAAAVTSADQQQQGRLPLREMTTALYAAAVLHELSHPAALVLLQQLQEVAAAGQLLSHPLFAQQAPQLAACLLVSQLAAPPQNAAGAAAAAAAADSSISSSGSNLNSWLGFSREVQQRLLESWRRKVLLRSQCRPHAQQQELALALKQLGLRCRANAVTPDGCVCIDIAATSPQGGLMNDCRTCALPRLSMHVFTACLRVFDIVRSHLRGVALLPHHRGPCWTIASLLFCIFEFCLHAVVCWSG